MLIALPVMIAHASNLPCPVLAEADELTQLIVADAAAHLPAWLERCRGVLERFRRCLGEQKVRFGRTAGVDADALCCVASLESGNWHVRLVGECDTVAAMLASCGDSNLQMAREIVLRIENVVALYRYHFARPVSLCLDAVKPACVRRTDS